MDHISPINKKIQIPTQTHTSKTQGDTFKTTLDQALQTKGDVNQASSSNQAGGLNEIKAPFLNIIQESSSTIYEQTNKLVDQFETYADALGNPNRSLKEIAPLIGKIKDNAQNLLSDTQIAGNANTPLETMANDLAVMANVEYLKFQRGDY